jgi:hypothetical protein
MHKASLLAMCVIWATGTAFGADVYVDSNRTDGTNDGTSWANAFRGVNGLQMAMPGVGNTIYVAEGAYKASATVITRRFSLPAPEQS